VACLHNVSGASIDPQAVPGGWVPQGKAAQHLWSSHVLLRPHAAARHDTCKAEVHAWSMPEVGSAVSGRQELVLLRPHAGARDGAGSSEMHTRWLWKVASSFCGRHEAVLQQPHAGARNGAGRDPDTPYAAGLMQSRKYSSVCGSEFVVQLVCRA
jgi:hypothetical protein